MGSPAIAYANLADDGLMSASNQQILLPASNVQTPHVEERWRSVTNSAYLVCDLGAEVEFDTIALFGLTAGAAAEARVRSSATDAAVESGILYDSGTLVAGDAAFDPDYGALVDLLAEPVTGRYVRIDLLDPDGDYVEAGRLFIGLRTAFAYNFAPGWSRSWVDRSQRSRTRGGQTQVWVDNRYRTVDLNFEWLSDSQRHGIVETIDRLHGVHADVLLIVDAESTNVPRDSVWGLVADVTPVTQGSLIDIFGKQYRIEERL